MVVTTALFLVALAGPANLRSIDAASTRLVVRGEAFEGSPWLVDLSLRSELFGLDGAAYGRLRRYAQSATVRTDATTVPAQTTPPDGGSATPATPAAECEQCDIDCETCRESDRQARYVLRRRAAVLRTHRAFAIATWASLLVTETLGTFLAINLGTAFGRGACISAATGGGGTRILGQDFGCGGGLTALHLTSAFITTGLYATTAILALAAPDPDRAAVGNDLAARTLRLHKAVAWVHAVGMIAMPILGILAANPQLFIPGNELSDIESRASFQETFRTVHTLVGYTTFAALTFAGYLELF